jgi:hypothetical protein
MIHKAHENGLIKGLAKEYVPQGVAVLQYAEDTILCLKDDLESAHNMKLLLCLFEKMSGLKINFEKSEALMISHDEQKAIEIADIMNCSTGSWPVKYLGVPVLGSRIHVIDLIHVVECSLYGWETYPYQFLPE